MLRDKERGKVKERTRLKLKSRKRGDTAEWEKPTTTIQTVYSAFKNTYR
jgi:hypothetical protein